MKTTIELPASLLNEAKAVAARESITLRALIEEALRAVIKQRKARVQPFVVRDARVGGEGLQPGWDLDDFAAIRHASYDDRGGDFEK